MDILIWACFIAGGVAITSFFALAGILGWAWARDQHSRLRIRRVPAVPRDGEPLDEDEQAWLQVIEQGYGDAPRALLRKLR